LACTLWRDSISNSGGALKIDLFGRQLLREWKTLRVSASFYNLARNTSTAVWISIGG
jgi:hypothetical protein